MMTQFEPLESRRMLAGEHPIGINFNDETNWDVHFDSAVAQAKQLGVTAVRLWLGISDYNARPSPSDPEPSWQSVAATRGRRS